MISGMFEAINASLNEELQLSIITNNLANVNVAGFKKDRVSFATMLRNQLKNDGSEGSGAETVQDLQLYRRKVKVRTDMSQGTLRHTGNPLDLAVSGEAHFKISTPQGIRYTRRGTFTLDRQGMIVTSDGHFLLGQHGPISVPSGNLMVDKRGGIFVEGNLVDTLDVVALEGAEYLEKEGNSLFRPGDFRAHEREVSEGTTVAQGYLEAANVRATEEMVMMLKTVRAYESYQKIIRALHDMDSKAINDAGRVK